MDGYARLKYRNFDNAMYEGSMDYTCNIEILVREARNNLDNFKVVDLSIMPGDRTHYNFRVQWKNQTLRHLHLVYIEGDWDVIIPRYMSPCFLKKHVGDSLNPWTAALVCDLANRICDSHHQSFYDWVDAIPTYILTESVPNGWEEEHVDCKEDENKG